MSQALTNKVAQCIERIDRLTEENRRLHDALERLERHIAETYQRKRGPKPVNGETSDGREHAAP